MTPTFPLISIYRNRGLNIFTTDNSFKKISTYTLIRQTPKENIFYDKDGYYWTLTFVSNKIKNNFLTRLLANTIYNPSIETELAWEKISIYNLDALKKRISICIDEDDDVITQFVEGDFLKEAVRAGNTFEEIILTLNKYVFKVDEE